MTSRVLLAVAGVAALAMPSISALAQDEEIESQQEIFDPRVCTRHKHGTLSEEEQEACEIFRNLDRHGRYKAIVMQRLRKLNKPPVAAIEILEVLPRRVDVSAEASTDEDGFLELHDFALEDADTGDVLAGPITTREPVASLETNQDLPQNVLVRFVVEDDLRAIDTAEEIVALAVTQCSNELFSCTSDGTTTCSPRADNNQFTTDDLLDAAQRCDRTITKTTQLTLTAWGGAGGKGAGALGKGGFGGEGGGARMVTTLAELDRAYEPPQEGTTYCYGIGQQGGHNDTRAGSGGAATLLRTCQDVSQTELTGVLLIAGGGGGGQASPVVGSGKNGQAGGIAVSSAGTSASGSGRGAGGGNGKGASGENSRNSGKDGVGGKGGPSPWGTAGWSRGNPRVTGSTGQGGELSGCAGAGGGGWGGGACVGGNGGGGGGSYAAAGLAQAPNPGIRKGAGSLTFVFAP